MVHIILCWIFYISNEVAGLLKFHISLEKKIEWPIGKLLPLFKLMCTGNLVDVYGLDSLRLLLF